MPEFSTRPEQLHQDVRTEVQNLMSLPPAEYAQASALFIAQRVAALEAQTPAGRVEALDGAYKGFIGSETLLLPFGVGKGYHLDDPAIYDGVLPVMRQTYEPLAEQLGSEDNRAYLTAALYTAQEVQQSYFGSVVTGPDGAVRREYLLDDFIDDDDAPDVRSIAEFREANAALCAERAAVASNVLQVLGMEAVYEMGRLDVEGRPSEPHAYLVVKDSKGKDLIFDPTNPTLIFDKGGTFVQARPAMYPAGDFLAADGPATVAVERKELHIGDEGVRKEITHFTYAKSPLRDVDFQLQ
jgi:hypothetical protein